MMEENKKTTVLNSGTLVPISVLAVICTIIWWAFTTRTIAVSADDRSKKNETTIDKTINKLEMNQTLILRSLDIKPYEGMD